MTLSLRILFPLLIIFDSQAVQNHKLSLTFIVMKKKKEAKKPKKKKQSEIVYSQTPIPPTFLDQAPVYYNGKEVIFEVRIVED